MTKREFDRLTKENMGFNVKDESYCSYTTYRDSRKRSHWATATRLDTILRREPGAFANRGTKWASIATGLASRGMEMLPNVKAPRLP